MKILMHHSSSIFSSSAQVCFQNTIIIHWRQHFRLIQFILL